MQKSYMLSLLYCQYHPCWCPGDLRSQGINRHGIDLEYKLEKSLASKELIHLPGHRCHEKGKNANHKFNMILAENTEVWINLSLNHSDILQCLCNGSPLRCDKPLLWQWWLDTGSLICACAADRDELKHLQVTPSIWGTNNCSHND